MTTAIVVEIFSRTRCCVQCQKAFKPTSSANWVCLPCKYKARPGEWD